MFLSINCWSVIELYWSNQYCVYAKLSVLLTVPDWTVFDYIVIAELVITLQLQIVDREIVLTSEIGLQWRIVMCVMELLEYNSLCYLVCKQIDSWH